jgi:hypothetical protein
MSVKPSAQPTLVRTQHLPPRKTAGQSWFHGRCGCAKRERCFKPPLNGRFCRIRWSASRARLQGEADKGCVRRIRGEASGSGDPVGRNDAGLGLGSAARDSAVRETVTAVHRGECQGVHHPAALAGRGGSRPTLPKSTWHSAPGSQSATRTAAARLARPCPSTSGAYRCSVRSGISLLHPVTARRLEAEN